MRDLLFRGQTRRKGERVLMNGKPIDANWVYGGIFQGKGDFSVIYTYEPIKKMPAVTGRNLLIRDNMQESMTKTARRFLRVIS